jgi:hypothetical protein
MKTDYQILPRHEPDGEGNGWETCREKLASAFLVVDLRTDEDADAFDTRGQAQAYVNAQERARVRALGLVCEVCDDAPAEVECEDITGYSRKPCDYLCQRCYDRRCDYGDDGRAWPQARNE